MLLGVPHLFVARSCNGIVQYCPVCTSSRTPPVGHAPPSLRNPSTCKGFRSEDTNFSDPAQIFLSTGKSRVTTTSQVHSRFSNDRMRSFVELSAPNRPVGSICGASNGPSQDPYGSVWPWQKNYKTDFCHFKKDTVSFGPCFFFRVALENLSFLLTIHAWPVRKIDKTVAGL